MKLTDLIKENEVAQAQPASTEPKSAGDQATVVEQVINNALYMSIQSHFWHWQTKSYACHTALGAFYDDVKESADEIAELFMGTEGQFKASFNFEMVPFDEGVVKTKLSEFKTLLKQAEGQLMSDDNSTYHGVGDAVLDLIKHVDKLNYMLTLK